MIDFLFSIHGISIFAVVVIIVIIQLYVFSHWFRALLITPYNFFIKFWNETAKEKSLKTIKPKDNHSTLMQIKIFKNIFPSEQNNNVFSLTITNGNVSGISSTYKNDVYQTIIESLNKYITSNQGSVSDFHLMKDIVDRNCDAKEEEIQTQVPVPLYLGLVGTMMGILVGVGFLVFTGGLNALLNSVEGNGSDGIEALLGGVALAMISSIAGIVLTTWGALSAKNAKSEVEKNKNTFLTQIQSKLLPNLTNDVSSSLVKMSRNLQAFNTTFSGNTKEFGNILSNVNKATADVAKTLTTIQKLDMNKIAGANINIYHALKNSTDEIGKLGGMLQGLNQYLDATTKLSKKLETVLDPRIGAIKEAVGKVDIAIGDSLKALKDNADNHLSSFIQTSVEQNQKFDKALEEQQKLFDKTLSTQQENFENVLTVQNEALLAKTAEITKLVDELKNLSEVKSSMSKIEKATKEQNSKLESLTKAIKELAETKAGVKTSTPLSTRVAVITGGSIISAAGLTYLIPQFIKWINELIKLFL